MRDSVSVFPVPGGRKGHAQLAELLAKEVPGLI